jgi:hypothetical protein
MTPRIWLSSLCGLCNHKPIERVLADGRLLRVDVIISAFHANDFCAHSMGRRQPVHIKLPTGSGDLSFSQKG